MWGVKLSQSNPFIYALFGIQPSAQQTELISQFTALLSDHPSHTDHLFEDGPGSSSPGTPEQGTGNGRTRIWLTYWSSLSSYKAWWTSPGVADFWASLPDDAGVWREVMTVPANRTQHGTNKTDPSGLGHLGERVSINDKSGYWGCYRHRLSASEEGDKMESSLKNGVGCCSRGGDNRTGSGSDDGARVDEDQRKPEPDEEPAPMPIHRGRVLVTNIPENICFVVEGQDHSALTPSEKDLWFKRFDGPVTQWIKDLISSTVSSSSSSASPDRNATSSPDPVILHTRLCYDPSSDKFRSDPDTPALNYNKKMQFFYFRDLRCLERIGRWNKGHVRLRRAFMDAYGPGGEMNKVGELRLWAETSVVKNGEMECEYVGCVEGTGLMGLAQ